MKMRKKCISDFEQKNQSYNVLAKGKSLLFCIRGDQGMSGLPVTIAFVSKVIELSRLN